MVLTSEELNTLLSKFKHEKFHISNNKISLLEIIDQPIIENFNCSGRPNGIYYSFGNSWLNFILNKKTSTVYKPCCFLYHVKVNPEKILNFPNHESIIDFHSKSDKYYLNTLKYNLCGEWSTNPTKVIPYSDLTKSKYKNIFDFYKQKRVVFDDYQSYLDEMSSYYIDFVPSQGLIRWDKLQNHYHGVEFENFRKTKKTPKWYNSLDVSSGCVWNPKSITELTLIGQVVESDVTNIWVLNDEGKSLLM
jgi:hypothetical protein